MKVGESADCCIQKGLDCLHKATVTKLHKANKDLFTNMYSSSSSETDEDIIMYMYLRRRRRRRAPPRQWVSDFLQLRNEQGAFQNMVQEIRETDVERFTNFHRMTPDIFDNLLLRIAPIISKPDHKRESLSPGLRLSLTLRPFHILRVVYRYLASGDSMVSLHYLYRVSKSSVSRIVAETCQALWDVLAPEVLRLPSVREWERIAEDFSSRWDFPNCVGAIDGKHVVVQCFDNTGSAFYNYKGTFSIVLLAACDAQYRFTYVSIGAAGRESDSGVFSNTEFGRCLLEGTLPLPGPKVLPGTNILAPHVFVGDNAFPLRENLLRPYPGQNIHASKTIFNYRLSRARRLIENSFGVLSNKFRIFRKPIIASITTVEKIVKAAVVLHNVLRADDLNVPPRLRRYMNPGLVDQEDRDGNIELGAWRADGEVLGLQNIPATAARNPSLRAKEVQDVYRTYFMTTGQVPFQWRKLPEHERAMYMN